MAMIRFLKNQKAVSVERGTNLMAALIDAGIPVASSCNGEGVCAKCRLRVIEGAANLSQQNETERDLREMDGLERNERISCQVEVLGDVTIDARYW
jgi:2Fe-2S ferredoxin